MVNGEVPGSASLFVKSTNFYIPPGSFIDVEEELEKLEEELKYTQGFLNSVMKKLSNERFVSSAPAAVVTLEKAKQADAELSGLNPLSDFLEIGRASCRERV